ncbi:ribose 5-phosphate isomerase [Sporocytophaga myxococcoides]|uniref:Ribose 5-phosphate isomerase n=1 Tax=Sporocytophaga myxococcoides TaxID=153721 RepID=A0A098LL82_9BACT|nr:ribose 5-phosphate isomerase B [Sporocytophaga myxococcoides]GAL87192.1 ribose 5-phosphate isomerase [Sporocytophaga myxococcoides]
MSKKIALGGDHAGYTYKKEIIADLQSKGYEVKDFGPFSEASVDYPDFVHPLSKAVESKEFDFGILICGSGNGVAITANKYKDIRASLCWTNDLAALARQHNDANVLCLPARFIELADAKKFVQTFINTPFEGGRHQNRVDKINKCY